MRGIVEELDNSGREVILIIQDYIERLRPPIMSVDKRMQLIDVSNQMHDMAIELDIPIVTASQLNRSGVSTIEEMRQSQKGDIGQHVGMRDISESFGMLKNFDANIAIVIEVDPKEERFYLSFRSLKYRGDDSEAIGYFLQPFVGKYSKIQLMEDINLEHPVFRRSLLDENDLELKDERSRLQKLERDHKTGLVDMSVDSRDEDISGFVGDVAKDQQRADALIEQLNKTDVMLSRDDDGFIVLIPKFHIGTLRDAYDNKKSQMSLFFNAGKLSKVGVGSEISEYNQDSAYTSMYR